MQQKIYRLASTSMAIVFLAREAASRLIRSLSISRTYSLVVGRLVILSDALRGNYLAAVTSAVGG